MNSWKIAGILALVLLLALPGAVSATDLSVSGSIAGPPVASFDATPVTGTSPLTVTFTDTSTGDPTSRIWDFGDGNSSWSTTETTFTHTYDIAGYYSVNLTVSNALGSDYEFKEDFIAAQCNFKIQGIPVPVGAATVFANEPNTIRVTLVKNTVGNSPETEILVTATDGWSARATVPAMTGAQSMNLLIGVDPTIRTDTTAYVQYTATIDPDNLVPETLETDNTKTCINKKVTYNGYKGVQYWNSSKPAPSTYLTYDIHGNVIHSFGDSYYKSGKGGNWQTLIWNWTAEDLIVPDGATVRDVRLYIPYCWDFEKEISGGLSTTTFNGVTVTPVHLDTDKSNFGAYAEYEYGLVTYNVTDLYLKNDLNVVTFTRTYWDTSPSNPYSAGSLSPAGFTVAVIYENPSETRKQIFINEGWDLLGASEGDYGTTEEEATSFQDFTGMTIDMVNAVKANLTTFVPWGNIQGTGTVGEGNLYVNDVQIGNQVWNYGGDGSWGETGDPQVAVDTRDILSYLNPSGTDNGIAIQSTAGASPCMVAERAFLLVEFPLEAPVADFSADPTTGPEPLTVHFTDESIGTVTSWAWDFDNNGVVDDYSQSPTYTFNEAGTYTVNLTVSNSGGSDTEIKENYIQVGAATIEVTVSPESIDFGTMEAGVDETGSSTVNVVVNGGFAWSVTAEASNGGYMGAGSTNLANAFELSSDETNYQEMTSAFADFLTGTAGNNGSGTAYIKQSVDAADEPGSYSITLTFTGAFD